jgi:hypothetical protein
MSLKEKIIELHNKGMTLTEISKELNCSKSTIGYHFDKLKINSNKKDRKGIFNEKLAIDLTGEKFGKLTVLKRDLSFNGRAKWICKCECGKEKSILSKHLISGATVTCRAPIHKTGSLSPTWGGYKEISLSYWSRIIHGAIKRDLVVEISIEDIWNLFQEQKGRCALTNLPIKLNYTASLDRIDSKKGYIIGNIQWVHLDINKMKMDIDQDKFINYCQLIVEHKKG